MNYYKIKNVDVDAGQGCRVSLFVSGNDTYMPFNYGEKFTAETSSKILDLLKPEYIRGLSIVGGEPLHRENIQDVIQLLSVVSTWYPSKDIWLTTNYTWKEICNLDCFEDLLYVVDVIVEKHDDTQRLIDVTATRLNNNKVVEWVSEYN